MFGQITPVVKNLLILNILMFGIKLFAQTQGIDLGQLLGLYKFGTPLFEPYQLISHFFMHGDFFHLLFNMFVLVSFGPFLEKIWGPRRFAIMYLVSAAGAVLLYNGIAYYQVWELKQSIGNQDLVLQLDNVIKNYPLFINDTVNQMALTKGQDVLLSYPVSPSAQEAAGKYFFAGYGNMMGASGAIMGLMASFAILFPNTQLQLLFPPIPIKAKFLIGGYFLIDLYLSIFQQAGDNVAHLAHVGGAVAGAILVLIWRRSSNQFY